MLTLEIETKQRVLDEKIELARMLESKYEAIKSIIRRNKERDVTSSIQRIPFPFLIVPTLRSNIVHASLTVGSGMYHYEELGSAVLPKQVRNNHRY